MMHTLVELCLGLEGLRFVEEQLRRGHALSRCLLSTLSHAAGQAITYLPQGTAIDEAKKFEYGGKLPTPPREEWRATAGGTLVPTPTTREHLVSLIATELAQPRSLCILENALAEREDLWLQKSEVDIAFLGKEVYHLLTEATSPSEIDAAVRAAHTPYLCVGALSSVPDADGLPGDRGELTIRWLEELAQQAQTIFVGAYDGEGYVLWRRARDEAAVQREALAE